MENVNKGKKNIIGIIVLILLIDIITITVTSSLYAVYGNHEYATYKLMQGMFRFLLTGILLFFLYKGHKWAKWLTTFLFIIGGLLAIISLLVRFNFLMLLMGIVYGGICIVLIKSSSIKDFMRYQRGEANIVDDISDNSNQELQ